MHFLRILQPFTLLILSKICAASSFAPAKHCKHELHTLSASSDDATNDEILKRLTEKYLGSDPSGLPEGKVANRLGDLYDPEELSNLLNVHKGVSSRAQEIQEDEPIEVAIPSFHDLVMEAVGETSEPGSTDKNDEQEEMVLSSIHNLVLEATGQRAPPPLEVVPKMDETKEEQTNEASSSSSSNPVYTWLTEDIREKMNGVTAIASDVDGTLIGSTQRVHPRTKDAVVKAVQDSFSPLGKLKWFFPATGKTRPGAMNSLGPELAALLESCPGVFIQGLYCMVGNTVVFEKKLEQPAIEAAEKLVEKTQTSIIAYDGDNLYTTKLTQQVRQLHEIYGEPMSSEIPSIAGHANGIHKILIYEEDLDKIAEVRKELEALAKEHGAVVTQAIPTMLELLPEGCSKALGVQKVCEVLGIDPTTDLLALGDAENDVEMLQLAAVGVCVGNGSKLAKDAADIVLEETSDEGAAGLAIEVLTGL